MQKYWWVNHKQTFKHEIEGGFLWSPKLKSDGNRNYFYDTMADAEVGGINFDKDLSERTKKRCGLSRWRRSRSQVCQTTSQKITPPFS